MTKKICFVIRPFEKEYYNRFDIVYKPAIERAGLIPRHAGGPDAEKIPVDVKKCIREAHICFVDITEDRPNVWYEFGLADDQNKPIIIVSNENFRDKNGLPSDISDQFVVFYNSEVDSDVSYRHSIIEELTERIKERAKKADAVQLLPNSDNRELSSAMSLPIADRQTKDFGNKNMENKESILPTTIRQEGNFDNFLTSLEGRILGIIFMHH